MNASELDALIAGFYRAATGEISWSQALVGVQTTFAARTAVLQSIDLRTGRILGLHNGGPPIDDGMLAYLREYHRHDPRRAHLLARGAEGVGTWWHCHEHFPEPFTRQDLFYRHFLPAYDTRYLSTVMLMPSPHVVTAFAVELPAGRGVLSADERDVARRLGLHMNEALRAHERLREMSLQALAGRGLMARLPYPMWLIDEDRFVHYANERANACAYERACDAEGRGLPPRAVPVAEGRRLVWTDTALDTRFALRLRRLEGQPHGSVEALAERSAPAWIHLTRLVPQAVLGAFGERPLTLVTWFEPASLPRVDAYALSQCLGLTPAQARVAVALGEGLSAEQIAQQLGVAVSTVRSHVRQVVAKLGLQRAVEAVRLLGGPDALWVLADARSREP